MSDYILNLLPVNDEERARIDLLLKEANEILNKGVRNDSE